MKTNGYTLVEMAVVLVIAGTLLGAGLKLLSVQSERAAISATQKNQEAIKEALINYLGRFSRLPCPDTGAIVDGLDNDRVPATGFCASAFGRVPYADLGLEKSTVLDGWDNYIVYLVSPGWVQTYSPNPSLPYFTTNIVNAFWPGVRLGQINVGDRFPANAAALTAIANVATGTGTAVALVSYGRTEAGATNIANNVIDPPTGADELTNVNLGGLLVVTREMTDIVGPNGSYDDIIKTISPSDFISPLIKNETFRTTTAVAVQNEINDVVIGQIINTKRSCASATPPLPPAGCLPTDYFYSIPANMVINTPNALAWGAFYVGNPDFVYPGNISANAAYIINVNGQSQSKVITYTELFGLLARYSGFH